LAGFQGIALQRGQPQPNLGKFGKGMFGRGMRRSEGHFLLPPLRLGLCSAISRIHSFLTKLFHHEEHEGHEVLNMTNCTIFLRALRVLRGEHWVAAGRAVPLR
jgi:hypothetical protein